MKEKTGAKAPAGMRGVPAAGTKVTVNLRVRLEVMRQIAEIVKRRGWTQTEAAERCGVTQPRINDLLRGRVSRFSLDALVNVAAGLGRRVRVTVEVS